MNAADIALLTQIGTLVGGSAGALGVIGVASRADEIGAGRIDAMLSAKDVATRFTAEMDKTGIFYINSRVRIKGITDGTSNTFLFGEHARTNLMIYDPDFALSDGQWNSGR